MNEGENNNYLDKELFECELRLCDEANSNSETFIWEDTSGLEAEFVGYTETDRLQDIA